MNTLNRTNETYNTPIIIAPWVHKVIKGHSGVQFGKNGERNNGICYFDFFEIIQEILMHLATYGEIPVSLTATFRKKLERYVSCLVKDADSEKILEICNAFREVVATSLPQPRAIAEPFSPPIMSIEICASSEAYLQEVPEVMDDCVENIETELIDSAEPNGLVDDNLDSDTKKLQLEIDDILYTFAITIDSAPINKCVGSFLRNIMDNLDNLVKHAPLNEYCRNVFSQVESHVKIWRKTLYDLYKENSVLKKSKNTRIGDKAKKDIEDIKKLKEAIILIKKRVKNFKKNFQTYDTAKEPTGP